MYCSAMSIYLTRNDYPCQIWHEHWSFLKRATSLFTDLVPHSIQPVMKGHKLWLVIHSWVSVNLHLDWCLLSGERITIANVNHICRQDHEIQSHTWYPEHCCPQWRDTRVSTVELVSTNIPLPPANGHLAALPASLPLIPFVNAGRWRLLLSVTNIVFTLRKLSSVSFYICTTGRF